MKAPKAPRFYFIKEIAIVVIGVLIAVSISNFKESQDNEAYFKKTMIAVKSEILASLQDVNDVYSRHVEVADSVQSNLQNDETLMEIVFEAGGIQIAETKNIGLRFFISHKADLVEYQMISDLMEIENTNRILEKKMDYLLEFAYADMFKEDPKSKEKFLIYLYNVMDSEQSLIVQYDDFLSNYTE
ncbi:MAG: hypothetical protein AAF487_09500 [Bacteroidota bacterium]